MKKQQWLFLVAAMLACTLFVTSCGDDKTPPSETSESTATSQESEPVEREPGEDESEPTENESEPAHVCQGETWVTVTPSTCTASGVEAFVCSCDAIVQQKIVAPLGHDEEDHTAKAPTCESVGWESYAACKREGCNYSTKVEMPVVSHDYENGMCQWCQAAYGSEGLFYRSNGDGTCVVIGIGTCTDTDVYIPFKRTNEDIVVGIAPSAFRGCIKLTSVTLPESVMEIGASAFYGCTSLSSITLPFVGEQKDESGETYFGYIFGASDYSNQSGYIPTSLRTVSITGGTRIGDGAFSGCASLSSITIPECVTSIGVSAFDGCTSLSSITIPKCVTSIGVSAFRGCERLASIAIPESVKSIGYSAFSGCTSLTSITIPENVTSIDDYAFSGCKSLSSITIPVGVTSIGYSAFYGCTGLTSITIPENVTSIGYSAFSGCTGLANITVANGNTAYKAVGNCLIKIESKTLILGCKNSVIPTDGSVTSIGDYAFYGCTGLASITIPERLTSIGSRAFANCKSLSSVTFVRPDGWTADGTPLSSTNLSDHATAARYLTEAYCFDDWRRR